MNVTYATDTYNNGQLEYFIPYINGFKNGLAIWWYRNGKLMYETNYENGVYHKFDKFYASDGNLLRVSTFHYRSSHGVRISFNYEYNF